MSRIKFKGESYTAGSCLGCGKLLFLSDPAPDASFKTFHEDPMCPWYLNRCALAENIGPHVATKETIEFVPEKKP